MDAVRDAAAEQFTSAGGMPRYELAEWHVEYGVVAGITARDGELDFNLGPGPPDSTAMARWQSLPGGVGSGFSGVVVGRQTHGTGLGTHKRCSGRVLIRESLDGHLTSEPGLLLAVTVADCVPIYLLEPRSTTMALLHAGWRGIAAGILEAGVQHLCELAKVPPSDLVMHCGVGICGSCYEVGPEVFEAVRGQRPKGLAQLDLREDLAVRARGVGLRCITLSPWCSCHDGERFFSHRRSGGTDGRMVAYLGRPAA